MSRKRITVLIKRPDEEPNEETIDNTLKALQDIVGGRIATLTVSSDAVIIYNDDGKVMKLKKNDAFLGFGIYGIYIIAGRRKDRLTTLKPKLREWLKRLFFAL